MGIDPATHKPKNNPAGSADSRQLADLSHMAQWEAARLEAEARLGYNFPLLHKLTSPPPPRHLAALPCLDVLNVWQSTANIPSCFFSSPAPTISSIVANDVVSENDCGACGAVRADSYNGAEGKTDNSYQVHVDYDCDLAAFNQDSDGYSLVGEFKDSKNYWDYLLNLVSSPIMELPTL